MRACQRFQRLSRFRSFTEKPSLGCVNALDSVSDSQIEENDLGEVEGRLSQHWESIRRVPGRSYNSCGGANPFQRNFSVENNPLSVINEHGGDLESAKEVGGVGAWQTSLHQGIRCSSRQSSFVIPLHIGGAEGRLRFDGQYFGQQIFNRSFAYDSGPGGGRRYRGFKDSSDSFGESNFGRRGRGRGGRGRGRGGRGRGRFRDESDDEGFGGRSSFSMSDSEADFSDDDEFDRGYGGRRGGRRGRGGGFGGGFGGRGGRGRFGGRFDDRGDFSDDRFDRRRGGFRSRDDWDDSGGRYDRRGGGMDRDRGFRSRDDWGDNRRRPRDFDDDRGYGGRYGGGRFGGRRGRGGRGRFGDRDDRFERHGGGRFGGEESDFDDEDEALARLDPRRGGGGGGDRMGGYRGRRGRGDRRDALGDSGRRSMELGEWGDYLEDRLRQRGGKDVGRARGRGSDDDKDDDLSDFDDLTSDEDGDEDDEEEEDSEDLEEEADILRADQDLHEELGMENLNPDERAALMRSKDRFPARTEKDFDREFGSAAGMPPEPPEMPPRKLRMEVSESDLGSDLDSDLDPDEDEDEETDTREESKASEDDPDDKKQGGNDTAAASRSDGHDDDHENGRGTGRGGGPGGLSLSLSTPSKSPSSSSSVHGAFDSLLEDLGGGKEGSPERHSVLPQIPRLHRPPDEPPEAVAEGSRLEAEKKWSSSLSRSKPVSMSRSRSRPQQLRDGNRDSIAAGTSQRMDIDDRYAGDYGPKIPKAKWEERTRVAYMGQMDLEGYVDEWSDVKAFGRGLVNRTKRIRRTNVDREEERVEREAEWQKEYWSSWPSDAVLKEKIKKGVKASRLKGKLFCAIKGTGELMFGVEIPRHQYDRAVDPEFEANEDGQFLSSTGMLATEYKGVWLGDVNVVKVDRRVFKKLVQTGAIVTGGVVFGSEVPEAKKDWWGKAW